eukprot:4423606-Pyramimonas_sp.AAC.1
MFGNCDVCVVSLCDQHLRYGCRVCHCTGRRHVEVKGRAMTPAAQTYPAKLSQPLAKFEVPTPFISSPANIPPARKLTSSGRFGTRR